MIVAKKQQGEWQDLTFTVYTGAQQSQEWQVRAPVFGVWAVHRPYGDEEDSWHVSHVPTGVMLLRIECHDMAILAARRLASIEPPVIEIATTEKGVHFPKMQSDDWFERAAGVLAELGDWEAGGNNLCAPKILVEAINRLYS